MAKYRKVLLALCLFTVGVCVHAQYLRTSYFMEGVSSRLQLNPALQPTNGYINIPVLGSLFLGTDYMFFGNNSKSVNGFIGISIPLGAKKSDVI